MTAPAAIRARSCPLCGTSAGEPCQPKPAADHLARYLDSYTAGQLTRAYMAVTLADLVVIDLSVVIPDAPDQVPPDAEHDYCGDGIDEEFERCETCKRARADRADYLAALRDGYVHVADAFGGDSSLSLFGRIPVRRALLSLPGIGPKTADVIMAQIHIPAMCTIGGMRARHREALIARLQDMQAGR
jgi:hypothetical protein